MTEMISTVAFHRAVADKGWRLIAGGPAAYFSTGSYAIGAALVQAIGPRAPVGRNRMSI